mgnify:CR=1 FL=1
MNTSLLHKHTWHIMLTIWQWILKQRRGHITCQGPSTSKVDKWCFHDGMNVCPILSIRKVNNCISNVALLYHDTFSSLLVVGGQMRKFSISRFVRQGCPLALFLSCATCGNLFNVFLNYSHVSLTGLSLPSI